MNCNRLFQHPVRAMLAMTCLALLTASAQAAEKPAAPAKVVTIEGITEYRLGNGLRVLLFPDNSTSNVTVNLTVLVGSRHEGYGETGMAHLLEHMLFKGTPRHPKIPKLLKERGASYNATTSYDRTNYYETLAGNDNNLEFALRLESDRFVNSLIRREDLVSEMTVVRNEFESGENSPDYILNQRMRAVAYEWHNYGKAVIGNRSDIERVPIDRLQGFYKKYYRPDNAVLTVAGKFKPDKALALIGKYFASLKNAKVALDKTYTDEPPQDGERTVVLRRVGKVGLVGAMYHIPSVAHEDYAPLAVLADILDVQPSGRLYKALVETKMASSVYGYAQAAHDPGLFVAGAQVGDVKALNTVRDQMLNIVENIGKTGVTQEEVDRIKRKFAKGREQALANSNSLAMALNEWIAHGEWRLYFLHGQRMARVTPEDVKRVAAKYLKRSNRTVGVFIPTEKPRRATIPESPKLAAILKDVKGGTTVAGGESFDPTPANIEKRVQRSRLGKDLKVALLPKKSRGNMVVVNLTLRFGNEKSLTGKTTALSFLGSLMEKATKKHNRQELRDELDKLGAQLGVGSSTGQLTVFLQVKRNNLPGALKLLGEILRQPTFPEKEFDILKRSYKESLEKSLTEPFPRAGRALQRRLHPYPSDNIRYTPTIEESLARLKPVTRDQVVKLYDEQLGGQVGELAVVGDFDPEPTLKLFEDILGDWKSSVKYERIASPARDDIAGAREEILTPDKKNALYLAGLAWPLKDSDPDYPALKIANHIFGGGALSSRLGNRIRQKDGLSYGTASQFNADALDRSASFLMYAICNPKNIDKVDTAVAEEVQQFLKDGATAEELAEAKKGYLQQMKQQWSRDSALAGFLNSLLHEGRTFTYYADYRKKIEGLTAEDLANAFRKHITPKKLVIIRAGDFKKKAPPKNGK